MNALFFEPCESPYGGQVRVGLAPHATAVIRKAQHVRLDTLLGRSAAFQALAHTSDEHRGALERVLARMEGNGRG